MAKAYQIVEPELLCHLYARENCDVFSVAILSWLCDLLRLELRDHVQHVEIEVIRVTFVVSKYPAIGIHYKNEAYQDIGPLAEAAMDRTLREKSLLEFAAFLVEKNMNWEAITKRIMSEGV